MTGCAIRLVGRILERDRSIVGGMAGLAREARPVEDVAGRDVRVGNGLPCRRRVAVTALVCRHEMRLGLAGRSRSIVAHGTTASRLCVVEGDIGPACRHMAVFTGIRRIDVSLGFARNLRVVVTREAGAGRGAVVEGHLGPACSRMARFAGI